MWYDGRSNFPPPTMELTKNGPWSLAKYWKKKGSYAADCVLELRARVEALEEANQSWNKKAGVAKNVSSSISSNLAAMNELRAEARPAPASSLVKRVASAIHHSIDLDLEARAAIRSVAVAARHRGGQPLTWEHVAQWLEQEAGR